MKRIYYLFLLLLTQAIAFSALAQLILLPEADVEYKIVHHSTLLLTYDPNSYWTDDTEANRGNLLRAPIKKSSGGDDQLFRFVPVADEDSVFYIQNVGSGMYLIYANLENDWDTSWTDDPTVLPDPEIEIGIEALDDAKFRIDTVAGNTSYLLIRNMGRSDRCLGTDAITDGSWIYTDKSGTDTKHHFRIVIPGVLDVGSLRAILDEAIKLYETTEGGTATGQYPEAYRRKFSEEINYCQGIIDDYDAGLGDLITQEEVDEALIQLMAAIEEYKSVRNPFIPSESFRYYFRQYSGLYLTASGTVASASYAADQQFSFTSVEGKSGVYYIKSVSTGNYMIRSYAEGNGWDVVWNPTLPEEPEYAMYKIESADSIGYYLVVNQAVHPNRSSSSLGSDATTSGSAVYLDKSGSDVKNIWMIISTSESITIDLEQAIANVEPFMELAEKGSEPGQYPADVYDALVTALADAKSALANTNATQTDIDEATLNLNEAFAACKEAGNPISVEAGVDYYIIHHSGLYLGEYSDSSDPENIITNKLAIFSNENEDNQVFQFVEVPDAIGVYNITVSSLPGMYLTRMTVNPENSETEDWRLIWGDDPTSGLAQFIVKYNGPAKEYQTIKCTTAGPTRENSYMGTDGTAEKESVWIDKTGDADNYYWTVIKKSDVGIKEVVQAKDLLIYSNNNVLTVSGLQGVNSVSVYSITGQLVSKTFVNTSTYTTANLAKGIYVVVVAGDSSYQGKVVVR